MLADHGTTRRIAELQADALERGTLNIWTVYDHPADFPHSYVARRFEVSGDNGAQPTGDVMLGELSIIRASFRQAGLTRLLRHEDDETQIVECWL